METTPADIRLLENRLNQLIRFEEYEKCVVIYRWIQELKVHYSLK